MPHIGAVMERSLQERTFREGLLDLVARSVVAGLSKRDGVIDDAKDGVRDVKTAFSSWDNCMQASFCKWPVIAVIAVGGLILLSIIWCCVRCICCGVSCCCECFYCLKCCGNCCGCCDPPRGKGNKYLEEPYIPPHHDQGYRSEPNMNAGFGPRKPEPPQYAEFDTGPKADADSLPAMPSWEGAGSKKVLVEEDTVEMESLKKPESTPSAQMNTFNASQPSLPNTTSPEARNPYGPPLAAQNVPNGYMATNNTSPNPYAQNGQAYDTYNDAGYGQAANNYANQGYGAAGVIGQAPQQQRQDYQNAGHQGGQMGQGYAPAQGYPQSRTPRPYNDELGYRGTPGPYGRGPGQQSPANGGGYGAPPRVGSPAQAGYGYDDVGGRLSPAPGPNAAYGYGDARRPSPGPNAAYGYGQRPTTPGQRSITPGNQGQRPGGMGGSYGQRQPPPGGPNRSFSAASQNQQYPRAPQRQYTGDSNPPYPGPPRRQYTGDSAAGQYAPQPEQGYSSESSRPLAQPSPAAAQDYSEPSTPTRIQNNAGFDFTSGYSRPTPPVSPVEQAPSAGGSAYPGYRPYKPQQ